MSRLPESLPAYLQKHFGICRRTFERWCARGDVPGAYRTRGGHWRVRKHTNAMLVRAIQYHQKNRRDEVRFAIILYSYPPQAVRELYDGTFTARLIDELDQTKLTAALYGITEADLRDTKLRERDPEKYHFLWGTSPPVRLPRAHEAVKERPLQTAAYLLRRYNGRKVTPMALARNMGVSVSTLYRRYGQRAVRVACEELV